MKVRATTLLPLSLERATALVLEPSTMTFVSAPLTAFTPLDPPTFPARWAPGDYRVRMKALSVLPLGEHTIRISLPPPGQPATFLLRDNGSGRLLRRWDHLITIEAVGDDEVAYVDEVDVDAGVLTVPIAAWAYVLYRWRQRRWRSLASGPGMQK